MATQPSAGDQLRIEETVYAIAEHPAAPGLPYGQEGRQAVVYQLVAGSECRALKVFKPRYRLPALVYLGEQLQQYATLPGLSVCRRTVLTPQRHAQVLLEHPDMIYAVLMPWIEGPTWLQVLVEKRELSPEQSLALARSLAHVLATMEQRGLAHCDLSGPNLLLPELVGSKGVALVDVEQMYSPEFRRPSAVPGGSPGYAHRMAPDGLWAEEADRFAGAVLLAEMLGWCDARVRQGAWGENYFEPREMQRDNERFRTLLDVLGKRWGEGLANLLERAWRSDTLSECATLGEWLLLLPASVPQPVARPVPEPQAAPIETKAPQPDPLGALLEAAHNLEAQGKLDEALDVYHRAQALAQDQPSLKAQLALVEQTIAALEQKRRATERSDLGTSTAQLFKTGWEAYQRQEWGKAKELLGEVVRREPGYGQDGVSASSVLGQIDRQLWLQRSRGWLAVLALLLLAALVWGAASIVRQAQEQARVRATATAVAGATGTARSRATGTTVAAATGTASAAKTATAAAQGTATAQAWMTATAFAAATSTAAAQATGTAVALATETAAAEATRTAAMRLTSTAVAAGTATVHSAGTATAQALAKLPTRTPTPVPRVPQLSTPAKDATFTGYVDMDFSWKAVGQPLAADEYYALIITFQHSDGHRYPYLQAKTKDTRWQGKLERFLYDGNVLASRSPAWQHGWYVVVMKNPAMNDKGQITGTEVSGRSEERFFTWKIEGAAPGGEPGPAPTRTPKI